MGAHVGVSQLDQQAEMSSTELIAPTRKSSAMVTRPAVGGALGAVAALVVWGLTMAYYPYARVPEEYGFGMNPPPEVVLAYQTQQRRVDRINMTVTFAAGGALLGVALAIAVSGRSLPMRFAIGIPGGTLWGGVAGFMAVGIFSLLLPKARFATLADTGQAQAAIFGFLGCGLGVVSGLFGHSARMVALATLGGALAGAIGGMLGGVITGIVAPSQSTQELMPREALACGLWLLVPFVTIGAAIPAAVGHSRSGDA